MPEIPKEILKGVLDLREGGAAPLPSFTENHSGAPNTPQTPWQDGAHFLAALRQDLGRISLGNIEFNHYLQYNNNIVELSGPSVDLKSEVLIQHISIHIPREYKIRNLVIKNVQIAGSFNSVSLDNCRIGRIELVSNQQIKLKMKNCDVGMLRIDPMGCRSLTVRGGHVLDLGLPPADGDNPFVGDVRISPDVVFPTRLYVERLATGQVYRNMQAHLADLKNFPLRDRFHAIEMEFDRRSSPWSFNSFVSLAYDVFAKYGLSAGRPLAWLVAMTVLSSLASGWFGLGVCEMDGRLGWRAELTDASWRCGVLLGTSPLTNPLGLFSKEPIAIATNWYWAAWLTVQGLLSAVLIALSVLAIRRKFRTQE
jgi:hypothetical protein